MKEVTITSAIDGITPARSAIKPACSNSAAKSLPMPGKSKTGVKVEFTIRPTSSPPVDKRDLGVIVHSISLIKQ
ncbi:MAG: hypothetical protein U0R19_24485 [Bryobacteraceae bacterium]